MTALVRLPETPSNCCVVLWHLRPSAQWQLVFIWMLFWDLKKTKTNGWIFKNMLFEWKLWIKDRNGLKVGVSCIRCGNSKTTEIYKLSGLKCHSSKHVTVTRLTLPLPRRLKVHMLDGESRIRTHSGSSSIMVWQIISKILLERRQKAKKS